MNAHDIADLAADKLTRYAEDLDAAGTSEQDRRTIADSQGEAAGALDRLADTHCRAVAFGGEVWSAASYQAQTLRRGGVYDAAFVRKLADGWRAWSVG